MDKRNNRLTRFLKAPLTPPVTLERAGTRRDWPPLVLLIIFVIAGLGVVAWGQTGTVLHHQKISETEGNFTGILDSGDFFGWYVAPLGDLDGDGVTDIAVDARYDDDGGPDRGAVWILFLNADGTVKAHQKISSTQGNFTGILDNGDWFGQSVVSIGDLNGDGVTDLAVGATMDDDGGTDRGAVWILFLNTDGTVKAHQKISDTQGGFTGILNNSDWLGASTTSLGDLDGDGVTDLAVAATGDDDGGDRHGAIWILFLNTDGTVKSHQKISDTQGNFAGVLDNRDYLGHWVVSLGDLDGDGVSDIAAGVWADDDGGTDRGAVWIMFLNTNGTVKNHQKISSTQGNFTGILDNDDWFGHSVAPLGDLDSDGAIDIAVGASMDDDGGSNRGAVWILFLNTNGTVKNHQKISDTQGNFTGTLDSGDSFGVSVASLGDLDGDGVTDIVAGALYDDDGGDDQGAVWILFLEKEIDLLGLAVEHIEQAITDKVEAQEIVDAALAKERAAKNILDNLLEGGELGDLTPEDICRAKQRIHVAIRRGQLVKRMLVKSVRNLAETLAILNGQANQAAGPGVMDNVDELMSADINGDGVVNLADLAILTRHWTKTYDIQQ